MSNEHIISISGKAHLSVHTGQLIIQKEEARHTVALIDIAVVLLNSPHATITSPALAQLAEAGAVVMGSNDKHLPVYLSMPLAINQQGAKRPHLQAENIHSLQNALCWQRLVQSKIYGQAHNLCLWNNDKSKNLERLAHHTKIGDSQNHEAQAARLYWQEFFALLQSHHGRNKQGADDIINACLNYGYAIMRAMIARSAAGAGLCLNFGVGHRRKDNPFNLIEDFMEVFRPAIDHIIMNLWIENTGETDDILLDSFIKKTLIQKILALKLTMQNKQYRLFKAVDALIYSYCALLEKPELKLAVPHMPSSRGRVAKIVDKRHTKI